MGKYIIKRLLWMIPVFLGVAILIFTIMYFVPGDPTTSILGSTATEAERENLRELMGLNENYFVQLFHFLKGVFLQFDFGNSYLNNTPVLDALLERLPRTLVITLGSTVLAVVIGVPLGIISAINQNKLSDRVCMLISLIGVSMPSFWLALMLILLFSLKLGWLPSFGIEGWKSYILPCVSGCFITLANLARQARSSMLDVIRADYITTARAKGVSRQGVIWSHALPNALIPIITVIGTRIASGLAGSLILENVFSVPGIGQYMINSINARDYPAVQGSIVFTACLFSIVILLVDLIYAMVDPRIKAQYTMSKRRKTAHG